MRWHALDNGVCATCAPTEHYLVDGTCEPCSDAQPLDENGSALLHALNELDGPAAAVRAAWSEELHPRGPGGKFRSTVDRLKEAITEHRAGELKDAHPFDGFNREQLRRVAKARGIELKRGESRDSIAEKLLGHLDGHAGEPKVEPTVRRPRLADKYLRDDYPPTHIYKDPKLRAALAGMFEFHDPKTGLRASLSDGQTGFGAVTAELEILDASDTVVGHATRTIHVHTEPLPGLPPGSRTVEHSWFALERKDPPVQGGGFATRWLHASEEQYRAQDIKAITLYADVDVGGYAWAKTGFDFAGDRAVASVVARTRNALPDMKPEERAAAQKLLDRYSAGESPTPLEFAMIGWKPGSDEWAGKQVMLGSRWHGVKKLA